MKAQRIEDVDWSQFKSGDQFTGLIATFELGKR
jgi:hypothetical protein